MISSSKMTIDYYDVYSYCLHKKLLISVQLKSFYSLLKVD